MELTPLRYFVTLARELHFRRAAEKLNMTQAPLSFAIKKLEDELETKLFERTSRQVRLTPAGEFFLGEAEAVLRRAEQARKNLNGMLEGRMSALSIGYNEPALNTFLPQLLARCREKYEKLQLELRELETAEQIRRLHEGSLDIGFMRPAGFELAGLESRLLRREEYMLVMPADHPLNTPEKIGVRELSGVEIILFAREVNPVIYDRISNALSSEELPPPRFRQDARNKNSMLAMVKAGFGAALMPESCCRFSGEGLSVRPLDIRLPPVNNAAVWNPEQVTGALKDFLSLLERDVISCNPSF